MTFGISGGSDNLAFELTLRVGESVPTTNSFTRDPQLNCLGVRFCALPSDIKEICSPLPRECIPATDEDHSRDGLNSFTRSPFFVRTNIVTREDRADTSFSSDADKELFEDRKAVRSLT